MNFAYEYNYKENLYIRTLRPRIFVYSNAFLNSKLINMNVTKVICKLTICAFDNEYNSQCFFYIFCFYKSTLLLHFISIRIKIFLSIILRNIQKDLPFFYIYSQYRYITRWEVFFPPVFWQVVSSLSRAGTQFSSVE